METTSGNSHERGLQGVAVQSFNNVKDKFTWDDATSAEVGNPTAS